jgi:hypothetical protein
VPSLVSLFHLIKPLIHLSGIAPNVELNIPKA